MAGYLYFATNTAMPGLTKIGFSESVLSDRFADLQSTGVPVPFELFAAFHVDDPRGCEAAVHGMFSDARVSQNREFFRIAARDAVSKAVELVLANTSASSDNGPSIKDPYRDLTEEERDTLAAYAMAPSMQRPHNWEWLERIFGMTELDGRDLFHRLRTKGYLREIRGRAGVVLYDLTPRGVTFGLKARDDPTYSTRYGYRGFYFQDRR